MAVLHEYVRKFKSVTVAAISAMAANCVQAQDFYEGKTITLVAGYAEGSPAAATVRLYERHFGRFIPGNPEIRLDFRPGQSGATAASHVAAEGPRDGTMLSLAGGKVIWSNILDAARLPYDIRRLNWIGSKSQDNVVCVAWYESGIGTLEDARRRDVRLGIIQQGTRTAVYAKLLNDLTATRFTAVGGFENVGAILSAMQERKVDAHCGSTLEVLRLRVPDWLEEGKLKVLVQFARNPDEAFPNVPLAYRVPRTDTGKRVMVFLASDSFLSQALMAPQDVPADRLEILRRAFDAMWSDETVREEAAGQRIAVDPVSGSALQDFVAQLHGAPQDVLWIVKGVLEAK